MEQLLNPSPEIKSANGDVGAAFDDFMRSFEAFRSENDTRLDNIERRSADVLSDHKVDRINSALTEQKRVLDELVLRGRRPALGGVKQFPSGAELEHSSAFDTYVRSGESSGLKRLEGKALAVSTNSGADGGYLVPEETEREIGRRLANISPIRAIAGYRQVSSNVYRKPFLISGAATGWVGETTARNTPTTSPTLAELAFPTVELYAMPAATQTLIPCLRSRRAPLS
jgi:HK97 family phage major capsid protein